MCAIHIRWWQRLGREKRGRYIFSILRMLHGNKHGELNTWEQEQCMDETYIMYYTCIKYKISNINDGMKVRRKKDEESGTQSSIFIYVTKDKRNCCAVISILFERRTKNRISGRMERKKSVRFILLHIFHLLYAIIYDNMAILCTPAYITLVAHSAAI